MIALPGVNSSSRASVDVFIPRSSLGLGQAPTMLADAWSVLQRPSSGLKGSAFKGQSKSCFASNKAITTSVVFARKKDAQCHKISDLDNEDLVREADLQYKPLGFGEGKVYDTSLEDKLLEDIEHEKMAKAAALQKQKSNITMSTNSSKITSKIVDGVKVWVGDLPKKKNIDRDLRSAFRHIPGLLDISPIVRRNEKTRDPICKGFGFLTFDNVDNAKSFISSFQGQPVSFGKVEKKVVFRLMKVNGADVVPSKKRSPEVGKLRIRDKNVVGSDSNTEFVSFKTVDQNVLADAMQEMKHAENYQPHVEVIENGETIVSSSLYGESSSEAIDSSDEFDSDGDPEFEISVEFGELSGHNAVRAGARGAENIDISDAEKQIEELERRIKKKLEDAGHGSQKGRREESTEKGRGFNSKIRASKQSLPKANNVAAVTHGLKKRERAFMTGVLEKYGKAPSNKKP